ncbi:unnamed protein product [Ectocarpus sp. 12 AP-2014]
MSVLSCSPWLLVDARPPLSSFPPCLIQPSRGITRGLGPVRRLPPRVQGCRLGPELPRAPACSLEDEPRAVDSLRRPGRVMPHHRHFHDRVSQDLFLLFNCEDIFLQFSPTSLVVHQRSWHRLIVAVFF